MKKQILIMLAMFFCLTGCGSTDEKSIPATVDVFELKWGEEKTISYKEQLFKLSLSKIQNDVTVDCSLADFASPEATDKIRIYAYLNVEQAGKTTQLKVSSIPCGAWSYLNNGQDETQDILNSIYEWQHVDNKSYFQQEFSQNFGESAQIEGSDLFVNIAKAYPSLYSNEKTDEDYKFIFILTKQN